MRISGAWKKSVGMLPRGHRVALALVGVWDEVMEDKEIDTMLEEIYAVRDFDGQPA